MTTFPDGFLWGSATAGHQVEGGNVNADLWPLEWAEDTLFAEPSLDACDHYHRYPEDIATMADLGFNAYRFSLEWSRIEPEPGAFSRAALDHYRRMVGTCLEHGITPVVTYCHFTTPRWFAGGRRLGGHRRPRPVRPLRRTGDRAPGRPPGSGGDAERAERHRPPAADRRDPDGRRGRRRPGRATRTATAWAWSAPASSRWPRSTARASRRSRPAPATLEVGWTLAVVDLQPADGGEDRWQEARQRATLDWLEVSREDDWVGVQTYTRERIGPDGKIGPPEGAAVTQTGWEVYPEALEHTVRLAAEHAGVPVLVTENGMATDDDEARIAYTRGALEGLGRAVDDGVDVRGYLHWTYLDNFEWMAGYAKTFGLVAVDRETYERTVKPSARWLGEVARANAL